MRIGSLAARIACLFGSIYRCYIYRPRLAEDIDNRRLFRITLAVILVALAGAFAYPRIYPQAILPAPVAPQKAEQKMPAKHYQATTLTSQSVQVLQLEQRIKENWNSISATTGSNAGSFDSPGFEKDGALFDDSQVNPDYVESYESRIDSTLERVGQSVYHRQYRSSGLRGRVLVRLVIGSDGQLRKAAIVRSSGNSQVDNLVLLAVRKAAPFDRFPAEMANRNSHTIDRYLRVTP